MIDCGIFSHFLYIMKITLTISTARCYHIESVMNK
jgi:hypothetical protein